MDDQNQNQSNSASPAASQPPALQPGTTPSSTASRAPVSASGSSPSASRTAQSRRPAAPSSKRGAAERSCIVCHRRKIRCDKTVPCTNCTRSGVLCCYPATKRTPRQPKTTISDIASRLVQLERTIVAISGSDGAGDDGDDDEDQAPAISNERGGGRERIHPKPASANGSVAASRGAAPASAPASVSGRNAIEHVSQAAGDDSDTILAEDYARNEMYKEGVTAAEEILLKNAYASRYINEVLLSRVLEEEQEFQLALTSPKASEIDESCEDASELTEPVITLFGSLTNSRFIARMPLMSNRSLHPPKAHALKLWQKYIQVVEPMNKILHVPTDEIDVFTAIDNPDKIDPAFESLLFSVYFATVTTYRPETYRAVFGEDKALATDRYRAGMDRALAQARFLDSPSLRTLQALTLFLRTSRAHSPGRSLWILYGMVLRAAQSIGLHRDGANFNLSPFESEMRRRVWGHMIGQDGRAAEDHGIEIGVADSGADIQVALNVNDSDIYPGMTALPVPQMRWTEMTMAVCLRRIGITMSYITRLLHMMKLQAASASAGSLYTLSTTSSNTAVLPLTEERRRAIMTERNSYVEDLLKQCNMVVPIQRTTYIIVRLVQLKFDFVSRLQLATFLLRNKHSQDNGDDAPVDIATEENLRMACEIVEMNIDMVHDEKMRDYQWSAEMFPQYHTLLYMLWHMCVRANTDAGLRKRAWAAVDSMFAMDDSRQQRQCVRGRNAKWAVLTAIREKAMRVRDAVDKAERGQEQPPHRSSGSNAIEEQDVAMADSNNGGGAPGSNKQNTISGLQGSIASQAPVTTPSISVPLSGAAPPLHPDAAVPASMPFGASVPTTSTDIPPSLYMQQDPLAGADMMEFLGDTAMGMELDMDWVRGLMDWTTVADDFRGRPAYDPQG